MIGFISGKIISKKPTQVLVDVNGVGYLINISINTFEKISDEGEQISLFTYLSVKEDSLTLFGFSNESEKQMFELLISVNGIGPKLAQSILSGIQVNELKFAISGGNISRIIAVPGIGKKTAERLLLDLRDKVDAVSEGKETGVSFKVKDDAVAALTSLGYNSKTADKVVRDILSDKPNATVEEVIRMALSYLSK